jgi:hypothetical protein
VPPMVGDVEEREVILDGLLHRDIGPFMSAEACIGISSGFHPA